MDTFHIRFIRRVAEHGNITATAREIGISQPALTKIISRMEDHVGARLFDRGRHGVTLTPFGEVFLRRMNSVELAMVNLANDVKAMKAGLTGTVSIGVGQFWLGRLLPKAVARLNDEMPDIRVKISTGSSDEMLRRMIDGELECVLGRINEDMPDPVVGEPLVNIQLALLVGSHHPLVRLERPIEPADLKPYGWVLPPASDPSVRQLGQHLAKSGIALKDAHVEVVSKAATYGILAETNLMTALPDIEINDQPKGITRLKAPWITWSRQAGFMRVKDRPLLPYTERLLWTLRDHLGQNGSVALRRN